MSKKSIIICVSVIGVFLVVISAALYILYHDSPGSKASLAEDKEYMLFSAVPSDAEIVMKFGNLSAMLDYMVSDRSPVGFFVTAKAGPDKMAEFLEKTDSTSSLYQGLMSSQAVISVHDIGKLTPLLIADAGRSGDEPSEAVVSMISSAEESGLSALYADAADFVSSGSPLGKRSLLLISPSDVLVQAALRHLKAEISVLDTPGFPESVSKVQGSNIVVMPASGIRKLAASVFTSACRPSADAVSGFAECAAFSLGPLSSDHIEMTGKAYSDGRLSDMMQIYADLSPSVPEVSSVLPSYTISAVSIPFSDVSAYQEAYLRYAQTRSLVKDLDASRAALKKATGMDPADWAAALDLREVAAARFSAAGRIEKILLARIGKMNGTVLFKGISDAEDSPEDCIFPYRYGGFLSSLFGRQFSVEDESCFLIHGKWLMAGSRRALSEYTSGRALDYTLSSYLSDASVQDRLSSRNSYFVSYMSLAEDWNFMSSVFSQDFLPAVKASSEDVSFEPVFFTVGESKSGLELGFSLSRTTVLKSQAPAFERDTTVAIPEGPFRVMNSGTGKWNLFYQQDNMYLCLKEEGGKGLWGVPFKTPICGCAQTVDYFANGKLQILFASGSGLYLIDRLGRFVNPFPVDLGKPVLLGPDVYDFSGNRKYNVMVLHTDNTVEMYNLQGRRPAQWKTITAGETIKGLPERIRVGGNSFWVVRTSIQTLIFGFYGGEPLTVFSGDRMIRPDSEVKPSGDNAVEVVCYDGKKHVIKVK